MKQEIQDIVEATAEMAKDIAGCAARAAVTQLTTNWTDAVNDNNKDFTARSAVGDIDDVIAILSKLKLRLSNDPLANRRMRVALGLDVEVPAWDSLSDEDREGWIETYRARHEYVKDADDVTEDAKADYELHDGIVPPDPMAYTR